MYIYVYKFYQWCRKIITHLLTVCKNNLEPIKNLNSLRLILFLLKDLLHFMT